MSCQVSFPPLFLRFSIGKCRNCPFFVHLLRNEGNNRSALAPETLELPRADAAARIAKLQAARIGLADDLQGTHLDLKTFVPLLVKHQMEGGVSSQASAVACNYQPYLVDHFWTGCL